MGANSNRGQERAFSISIDHLVKGKYVGSSSFYDMPLEEKVTSIRYTWFHQSYWGSDINQQVKHMMFAHAFSDGINGAAFSIDVNNIRSKRAVEKLGAKFESILRQDMIRPDGSLRNSVIYSMISWEYTSIHTQQQRMHV